MGKFIPAKGLTVDQRDAAPFVWSTLATGAPVRVLRATVPKPPESL